MDREAATPDGANGGIRGRVPRVLLEHPSDVDARIGLGAALTRRNAWREALDVLLDAEKDAGANADLFAALARAYRRAGDDRRALEYYERAKALAPDDPDVVDGFEATTRRVRPCDRDRGVWRGRRQRHAVRRHWWQRCASCRGCVSRAWRACSAGPDRLTRWAAAVRSGESIARPTWLFSATGGSGNTSLPTSDLTVYVVNYAGVFEIGASLRRLSFTGVDVIAASPQLAWDTGGRWRLDGRYTYSRSSFDATGEASDDHSVVLARDLARLAPGGRESSRTRTGSKASRI